MKKLDGLTVALAAMCVCVFAAPLPATLVPPDIAGTITATEVNDGWFLYEISLEWDMNGPGQGAGLSHWDIIFQSELYCPILEADIEFDTPAGYSTDANYPTNPDPCAITWLGEFDATGDTSLDPDVTTPVIKYNEYSANPGDKGYGTFWFYSNAIPVNGTYTNALVAKAGQVADTYGDLVGDAPSCTIPEPGTVCLLGLGALALLRKRRVRA